MDRPILFSGPLIRAILSGAKTQTRRVVKGATDADDLRWYESSPTVIRRGFEEPGPEEWRAWAEDASWRCPYGIPGDRLWVRETHAVVPWLSGAEQRLPGSNHNGIRYRATWSKAHHGPWRPSIFMLRECSRITLEVTDIRVERLQAISEEDAIAEGLERSPIVDMWRWYGKNGDCGAATDSRLAFRHLWESVAGAESWAANPWVWVVGFKRVFAEAA